MSLQRMISETGTEAYDLKIEKSRFTTITGSELLSRPMKELPMLATGLIPKVGVSVFAGASDLGKSALLRQMVVHIVTGEDFFIGFKLNPTHNSVLFICSEDDEFATSSLLHKICDGKYSPEQLERLRFVFDSNDLEHSIRESLEKEPADLVIVDCLLDFYGSKNLNAANEFRAWLNPFKRLAAEFETQIVFLHHLGKRADEREPSKSNLLGSGAIEHAPRLVFELRAGESANQRFLCILKANFLPAEDKMEAHELRFEGMKFTSTGVRRPSYEIVKRSPTSSYHEHREQVTEQARKLSKEGISQREISKQLNISLGTVNKYLKEVESVHVHGFPRVFVNVNGETVPF